MIPRIIHQIWIGDKEVPTFCKDYSNAIKELYKDYQIKIWDLESLQQEFESCKFSNTCLDNKFWDYVVDWYRAKVLNKYGGIYLDYDVKAISKLKETLLDKDVLIPLDSPYNVSNYIVGVSKNNRFTQKLISYYLTYNDDEFSKPKWSAPDVYREILVKTFGEYCVYKNNGEYTSKNKNLYLIDMPKGEYFEHDVSSIENYFKNE